MRHQSVRCKAAQLRADLVRITLSWEDYLGVAPQITNAISELDAALLVGMTEEEYCADGKLRTAVTKGKDFTHQGIRYQVTANRPSGKKGSKVTRVSLGSIPFLVENEHKPQAAA